jgi:hypothetical protein
MQRGQRWLVPMRRVQLGQELAAQARSAFFRRWNVAVTGSSLSHPLAGMESIRDGAYGGRNSVVLSIGNCTRECDVATVRDLDLAGALQLSDLVFRPLVIG